MEQQFMPHGSSGWAAILCPGPDGGNYLLSHAHIYVGVAFSYFAYVYIHICGHAYTNVYINIYTSGDDRSVYIFC